ILTRLRSMRKFIVFDEPDCWVKPDLITAFVTTLTRACESLGAQALFISHHDYSHFPESVAVTRISPDGVEEVRAGKTYSS
ncbi:hypothetical protein, partial [Vibrio cholerae]|uniref:hypothetical protein n=1 Tax=Vibrio cholerae TaxID=666 RepID=UPI00301C229D